MPASVATLLTFVIVLMLLARTRLRHADPSFALWLPVLWLTITGSRFVSQWLSLGVPMSAGSDSEGSTLDAIFFGTLMVVGFFVLLQRQIAFGEFLRANAWLALFLAFGLLSVAWSDYPFIAFKRWTKAIGHPVMALIILTDPDPVRAIRTVLKRCSFVLLPVSVLLIKYYPEYGRSFDLYDGMAVDNGAALTKNGLGYVCMTAGLLFVWQLLWEDDGHAARSRTTETFVALGMLAAVLWLLYRSGSATSATTFAVGALTMIAIRIRVVNARTLTTLLVLGLVSAALLEYLFEVYEQTLLLLGRDPTLTDRTVIWRDVIALQGAPLIGTGFESFWLGPRLEVLWDKWWWRPNQAHNGYIETYLNLGYVGVFLLAVAILSAYSSIRRSLVTEPVQAPFRLALLIVIVLFNLTEAGFKGVHFMWTMFYLVALEVPVVAAARAARQQERPEAGYEMHRPRWQR